MNNQKVEQSLREILDKCGEEIIHDHNRFQSAVFDLLDKINDSEERLVLKHAMDSNAFWMLLETTQITADSAKKAIEQIQKESHMAREDAEFVVRCVVSVSGINQDAVMEEAVQEPVASKEEQCYETKTPVQVAEEPAHVEYDSSNKKNKKIIGVTAAVVCLMVLAILLVSYHGSAPEAGQTADAKQTNSQFLANEKPENDIAKISEGIGEGNKTAVMIGDNLDAYFNFDDIVIITFVNTLDSMPDNALDLSKKRNGSVMAWTEHEIAYAHLFIGSEGRIALEDCSGMFEDYENVEKIEFNNCVDTSQVTNMSSMFHGCRSLQELDLSGVDTSQVTDMSMMFSSCSSLTELDLSGFNTSWVTDMGGMFSSCSSLTELDLSGFNTIRVTDMGSMFSGCSSLTELDLSGFNTFRKTDRSFMFYNCGVNLRETGLRMLDFQ